ncbi:MAG: hypothetical protein ACI9YH_000156 [Colwellia sp.]|jgi:hypothetical protein
MSFSIFLTAYFKSSFPAETKNELNRYANFQKLFTSDTTELSFSTFECQELFNLYSLEILPNILIPALFTFFKEKFFPDEHLNSVELEYFLRDIFECSKPSPERSKLQSIRNKTKVLNGVYFDLMRDILKKDSRLERYMEMNFSSYDSETGKEKERLLDAQLAKMARDTIIWLIGITSQKSRLDIIHSLDDMLAKFYPHKKLSNEEKLKELKFWFQLFSLTPSIELINGKNQTTTKPELLNDRSNLLQKLGVDQPCELELLWIERFKYSWTNLNETWKSIHGHYDEKTQQDSFVEKSFDNATDENNSPEGIVSQIEEVDKEELDFGKISFVSFEDDTLESALQEPDDIVTTATKLSVEENNYKQEEYELAAEFLTFTFNSQENKKTEFWLDLKKKGFSSYLLCKYSVVALSMYTPTEINKSLKGKFNTDSIGYIKKKVFNNIDKVKGDEISKLYDAFNDLKGRLDSNVYFQQVALKIPCISELLVEIEFILNELIGKRNTKDPSQVVNVLQSEMKLWNLIAKLTEELKPIEKMIRSEERLSYIDVMTEVLGFKLQNDEVFNDYLIKVSKADCQDSIFSDPQTNKPYHFPVKPLKKGKAKSNSKTAPKYKFSTLIECFLLNLFDEENTKTQNTYDTRLIYESLSDVYELYKIELIDNEGLLIQALKIDDDINILINSLNKLFTTSYEEYERKIKDKSFSFNHWNNVFSRLFKLSTKRHKLAEESISFIRMGVGRLLTQYAKLYELINQQERKTNHLNRSRVERVQNFFTSINTERKDDPNAQQHPNSFNSKDWKSLNKALFSLDHSPEKYSIEILTKYNQIWQRIINSNLTSRAKQKSKLAKIYGDISGKVRYDSRLPRALPMLELFIEGGRNE